MHVTMCVSVCTIIIRRVYCLPHVCASVLYISLHKNMPYTMVYKSLYATVRVCAQV